MFFQFNSTAPTRPYMLHGYQWGGQMITSSETGFGWRRV